MDDEYPKRRTVKYRKTSKRGQSSAVIAQRKALRLAARSVASRHYYAPGPYPAGELKGMDTNIQYVPGIVNTTNTNANILALNLVRTGTGSWNRIGKRICSKSLRIQGRAYCSMTQDATNDVYGNLLRMIVVWDKQPSGGAYPTFDNIFSVTDQAGVETSTWYSPRAFDTADRYKVIKDWTIKVEPDVYPSASNFAQYIFDIDEYISLPNLETNYSGQSTPMDIPDINSGALYFIARAATNTVNVTQWAIDATARLRYTDL